MMYFTLRNINLAFGDHFILPNSSFTLPNSVSNDRILFLKFEKILTIFGVLTDWELCFDAPI